MTSNPTPDPDSTPETARRDRYANALARITVGHSAFIKVDVQAEYKRAEAVMAVADTELAVLGEQLDEAGETIAQQTAALAQADERVEFYEAAHARMRDRLEVTRVRVRRAVAGSELESAVEAALAAAAPSVSAVDQTTRDRIAETLAPFFANFSDWESARINAGEVADAVMAVLRGLTLRELELLYRPNTTPSRPEPRLPNHTVNEEEAPAPVKQRADCTELEWAEQERARFERLYTRETVRADLAEARADTAARDADIYQQRLERLGEGYTRERKRAEAMERAMESTAADALAHRGCHRDLMGQCLRAERAEAEVKRLRVDRTAVLLGAAQHLYTALFPAVYDDLGQKAAEGVQRAVSELRRLAAEAPQPEPAAGEQQPDTETPPPSVAGPTSTALRIRVLREVLDRMDGGRGNGDSATEDVPAAQVRAVFRELLADMQGQPAAVVPAAGAGQDETQEDDRG